jgi:hypothetical protein
MTDLVVEPTTELTIILGHGWRVLRVPSGAEDVFVPGTNCQECGTSRGRHHAHGCDREACPRCAGWLTSCPCTDPIPSPDERPSA